jgi:hypothetical protein
MREALSALAAVLDRCYVLDTFPEGLFPHLFAWLRSEAASNAALAEPLERERQTRVRPWLRFSGGSDLDTALIRTCKGHPSWVESCDLGREQAEP